MKQAVIIGTAHMHANEIAEYLSQTPGFSLAGVARTRCGVEEVPPFRYTEKWNFENIRNTYSVPAYDDFEEMLSSVKPDIAFVLTENSEKPRIAEACFRRGIFTVLEKPLAASFEEALAIDAAAKKYNAPYLVNWPILWRPYLYKLKAALDAGVIGAPLVLRYLNGHTGPLGKGARHRGVTADAEEMQNEDLAKTWWHQQKYGGGVLLDIGCYGCFFTEWLLGSGQGKVSACAKELNTPFGNTADNFAATLDMDGKMAVLEGTWLTPRAVIPSGPTVIGTNGVLVCTGGAEDAPDVVGYDSYGNALPLPGCGTVYPNLPAHLAAVEKGETTLLPMLTPEKNLAVMKLLGAVIRSAEEGAPVAF